MDLLLSYQLAKETERLNGIIEKMREVAVSDPETFNQACWLAGQPINAVTGIHGYVGMTDLLDAHTVPPCEDGEWVAQWGGPQFEAGVELVHNLYHLLAYNWKKHHELWIVSIASDENQEYTVCEKEEADYRFFRIFECEGRASQGHLAIRVKSFKQIQEMVAFSQKRIHETEAFMLKNMDADDVVDHRNMSERDANITGMMRGFLISLGYTGNWDMPNTATRSLIAEK